MKFAAPFKSEGNKHCLPPAARRLLALALTLAFASTSAHALQAAKPKRGAARKPAASGEASQPLSARDALDRARSAASQKERIELLEKIIASPDREPSLDREAREMLMKEYALSGEQHLREGSPQLAMQAFKSLFKVAPAVISDKVFGQFIFPLPVAMNAFGYRAESAQLMQSFEPRFENDANRLIEIGFFYVQIEAPFEAVRVLEKAVRLAPDNHRAHNSLGTAYLINLRLDEAAGEFERALELEPKDEYANLNLANLSRATGDYQRAVTFYRKQIALKSDDSDAHGGLAIALLALGRDEEAQGEIKRAQELMPANYHFLTQLAYFYTNRKKTALARPLIEQAARIEPRYAWAHIAKANIDALDSRLGDALSTMIAAQNLGSFATLRFELVKALMAVDGYDQALEVMSNTFTVNEDGEFEARLGDAIKMRSPRLDLLLERERQASLFFNEHPTTTMQYRLSESLGKINYYLKSALAARKAAQPGPARRRARAGQQRSAPASEPEDDQGLKSATRPRRANAAATLSAELSAGSDSGLAGVPQLMREITRFTTLDDGRQAFRMVWASRKLTEAGVALDAAEQLARKAIVMAEAATEPEGFMRDAPLLNREGRRAVFLGRAYDALGWALLKKGETRGAVEFLTKSVDVYLPSAERKTAMWHLAVATQESGNDRHALDLYIASYEPGLPTASVRRAQIEALYKKINGSLAGLDEKLKQQ